MAVVWFGYGGTQWLEARGALPDSVRVVEITIDDSWFRDTAPTVRAARAGLAMGSSQQCGSNNNSSHNTCSSWCCSLLIFCCWHKLQTPVQCGKHSPDDSACGCSSSSSTCSSSHLKGAIAAAIRLNWQHLFQWQLQCFLTLTQSLVVCAALCYAVLCCAVC